MKANDFVKKFGLKITKKILSNAPDWAYETAGIKDYADKEWSENYPMGAYVKVGDLKRLVESHEVIERCGGIDAAKDKLKYLIDWLAEDWTHAEFAPEIGKFKQAIADVESCL